MKDLSGLQQPSSTPQSLETPSCITEGIMENAKRSVKEN